MMIDPVSFLEYARTLNERARRHADFFQGRDKQETEFAVVRIFLNEIGILDHVKRIKLEYDPLCHKEPIDPPDAIVTLNDDTTIGIEVTEIVKGKAAALAAQKKATPGFDYVEATLWTVDEIIKKLLTSLKKKIDNVDPTLPKLFKKYWILIHTDEPDITVGKLKTAILSQDWTIPNHINGVWIVMGYRSAYRKCPVILITHEDASTCPVLSKCQAHLSIQTG